MKNQKHILLVADCRWVIMLFAEEELVCRSHAHHEGKIFFILIVTQESWQNFK
jgi:hypothetical protein